jgi:hypothetical protein
MERKLKLDFAVDVKNAAEAEAGKPVQVDAYDAEIGGFGQGGYMECVVRVTGMGKDTYVLMDALKNKGYRIKR